MAARLKGRSSISTWDQWGQGLQGGSGHKNFVGYTFKHAGFDIKPM